MHDMHHQFSAMTRGVMVTNDGPTMMTVLCHGTLSVMTDPVSRVLEVSARLKDLRERLDQLDSERAAIQGHIAACMEDLASSSAAQVMPAAGSGRSAQILWVLRKYHDRPLSPMDVAQILGIRSASELTNVRVLLSRMSRDGRARKVGHGRYMTVDARN
jgi:hypothetical protein